MSESIRQSDEVPGRRANWSREQTLLAFQLYCETPFGQLHGRNKRVIELAKLIGRTPSALAMKCVNMASLDPRIRESGRSGLSNASALDRQVWDEFHSDWARLVEECEVVRARFTAPESELVPAWTPRDDDGVADYAGETRAVIARQRIGQAFFRRAVLSSYGNRCCISGVSDRRLLVASHIVAWTDDPSIRLHPGNGLCLSAIHDRAFDCHLFTLTDDYRVMLSASLKSTKDEFLRQVFWSVEGTPISLPDRFLPEIEFISRHRDALEQAGESRGTS